MVMLCFIVIIIYYYYIIIIIIDGIYDTELFLEDSGDVVRNKEIDIPRFLSDQKYTCQLFVLRPIKT